MSISKHFEVAETNRFDIYGFGELQISILDKANFVDHADGSYELHYVLTSGSLYHLSIRYGFGETQAEIPGCVIRVIQGSLQYS